MMKWIYERSIKELQTALSTNKLTSFELVQYYLERIIQYDQQEVKINSVLEINPDALDLAAALDHERKMKGSRGPLHGIPILLKDNIDTQDKMHTSAGSLALASSYAKEDAFLVHQLRKAGAIILGKANLTEFANFMTENMPNGYSSRGGQVLNPYGPGQFDVGGSSSGPGAAVAADFAPLAIGTETSGSILSPASSNSIVGIKPTVGLISRTGIIPIAHSQDTAGPMAKTVEDATILLGALTGVDEVDPITRTSIGNAYTDYTPFLNKNGLKGARIGIARTKVFDWMNEEQLNIINQAIKDIEDQGAVIIDPVTIPSIQEEWDYNVLFYEFKSDLNYYLSQLDDKAPVHSLREVIEFNKQNEEATLKYGQTILLKSEETSGQLTEVKYIQSRLSDIKRSREQGIDYVMKEHQLDAIVFPANFGAGIAAKAGYPSITVPAGYTKEGEPFGITFSGLAYSEPTLIKLAYAYEQTTKHRVPPKIAD